MKTEQELEVHADDAWFDFATFAAEWVVEHQGLVEEHADEGCEMTGELIARANHFAIASKRSENAAFDGIVAGFGEEQEVDEYLRQNAPGVVEAIDRWASGD